jgi:hypothetical protein
LPRKTKKADLDITAPSIGGDEPHLSGVWEVFEGYAIREPDDGPPYVEATGELKKTYRPLADTPHLFLEFARLEDKSVNREVLEGWLSEYGVLGMHYDDGRPYVPAYYPEPATPPLMYFTEGGPGETASYYGLAIMEAAQVLSLFDAASNKDAEALMRLLGDLEVKRCVERALYSALAQRAGGGRKVAVDKDLILTETLVNQALMKVWRVVQDKLSNFTYPTINHELPSTSALPHFHKGAPLAPHRFGASWGFRNLIGAMYLQCYWLITSRADIKRCKNCGRIISLAPPTFPDGSKGRKPRSDKEYCNKSCQQREDYERRVKPKREQNRG